MACAWARYRDWSPSSATPRSAGPAGPLPCSPRWPCVELMRLLGHGVRRRLAGRPLPCSPRPLATLTAAYVALQDLFDAADGRPPTRRRPLRRPGRRQRRRVRARRLARGAHPRPAQRRWPASGPPCTPSRRTTGSSTSSPCPAAPRRRRSTRSATSRTWSTGRTTRRSWTSRSAARGPRRGPHPARHRPACGCAGTAGVVRGRPGDLATVLQNLLVNAEVHAPGSPVTVQLVAGPRTGGDRGLRPGPGADRGRGRARSSTAASAAPSSPGSGLGLYVARTLHAPARRRRRAAPAGWAARPSWCGCPPSSGAARAPTRGSSARPRVSTPTLRALSAVVVDDHRLLAQSIAISLRQEGVDCTVATLTDPVSLVAGSWPSGRTWSCSTSTWGPVSATAPRWSPRWSAAGCRVLLVTASTDPVRLAAALEAGAVGVLAKTEPIEVLLAAASRRRPGRAGDRRRARAVRCCGTPGTGRTRSRASRRLTDRERTCCGALAPRRERRDDRRHLLRRGGDRPEPGARRAHQARCRLPARGRGAGAPLGCLAGWTVSPCAG